MRAWRRVNVSVTTKGGQPQVYKCEYAKHRVQTRACRHQWGHEYRQIIRTVSSLRRVP